MLVFSLCHFACLFRSSHQPLLALLLLSSARLVGLQLLHEIIQDLLRWHGGHIYNILLQKRHLYPSRPAPAVTTRTALLPFWWGVSVVNARGWLLLLLTLGVCCVSIACSHFLTDSIADVDYRERWAVVGLALPRETGFTLWCLQLLYKRHEGCDPLLTCLWLCQPAVGFRSVGLAVGLWGGERSVFWSRGCQKRLHGLSGVKVLLQQLLYQARHLEVRHQTPKRPVSGKQKALSNAASPTYITCLKRCRTLGRVVMGGVQACKHMSVKILTLWLSGNCHSYWASFCHDLQIRSLHPCLISATNRELTMSMTVYIH